MKIKYLDLIFEGKNKAYGAYQLRRKNFRIQLISFLTSSTIILLLFLSIWIINRPNKATVSQKIKMKHEKVLLYSQLSAPPPIETIATPNQEKRRPKIVKQQVIASKKFLPPVVKPDAEVQEEVIPTQEELKYVNPGTETKDGDSLGKIDLSILDEAIIDLDIDQNSPVKKEIEPKELSPKAKPPKENSQPTVQKIYNIVEQPPKFPGGTAKLMQFLSENLTYPLIARENGIQGNVILKLLVEPDGSISEVDVLRKIGGGCEEEAIRVAQLMPKWEPGIQNERPVRVSVVLPVKFKLDFN